MVAILPKIAKKQQKILKITNKLPQMYRHIIAVREHQQKQQIPVRKTCAAKLAMEYGVFRTIFKRRIWYFSRKLAKVAPTVLFWGQIHQRKKQLPPKRHRAKSHRCKACFVALLHFSSLDSSSLLPISHRCKPPFHRCCRGVSLLRLFRRL